MFKHSKSKKSPGGYAGLKDLGAKIQAYAESENLAGLVLADANEMLSIDGTRSLTDENYTDGLESLADRMSDVGRNVVDASGQIDYTTLSDAQRNVVSIMSTATGKLGEYHTAATRRHAAPALEGIPVGYIDMSQGWNYSESNEAFNGDEASLKDLVGYSIAMNVEFMRQSDLMKEWFKPLVLTPENTGFMAELHVTHVLPGWKFDGTGKLVDTAKRTLIDAAYDHTILTEDALRLIPYNPVDNSNAEYFLPSAKVAPFIKDLGNGRKVRTAPLLFNKPIGLINIAQGDISRTSGMADYTDGLDDVAGLDRVWLDIDDSYVILDVNGRPSWSFYNNGQTRGNDMVLTATSSSLQISKQSRIETVGGADSAIIAKIKSSDWVAEVFLTVTGALSMDTGELINGLMVNANVGRILGAPDSSGNRVELDRTANAADYTALADALKNGVHGWEPNVRYKNANLAVRGIMVGSDLIREFELLPAGSPINVDYPVGQNDVNSTTPPTSSMLVLMAQALNLRARNQQVTSIISHFDDLRRFENVPVPSDLRKTVPLAGLTRALLRCYTADIDVNVSDFKALSEDEVPAAICDRLVNVLRDAVFEGVTKNRYDSVLRAMRGNNAQFKVLGLTTQMVKRYLMVSGDTRTLSDGVPFLFDAMEDLRLMAPDPEVDGDHIHHMYVTVAPADGFGTDGYDPMAPGVMMYMPEFMTNVQMTLNSRTFRRLQMTPRFRFLSQLCFGIRLKIRNLKQATRTSRPLPIEGEITDVTPPVTP